MWRGTDGIGRPGELDAAILATLAAGPALAARAARLAPGLAEAPPILSDLCARADLGGGELGASLGRSALTEAATLVEAHGWAGAAGTEGEAATLFGFLVARRVQAWLIDRGVLPDFARLAAACPWPGLLPFVAALAAD